jgi:peptidoglycan hydrolase CwlO-like protein
MAELKTEEHKYQLKCNNMSKLFILPAISVTGNVVTIVALLLVAVLIGYLTAWYYAKSVYTPVIKKLEAEKTELIKQVAGLKDDITRLNAQVDKLNEKIGKLNEEIAQKDKEIDKLSNPKK